MSKLGTTENPCRNNKDISKIIRSMANCNIYTIRTFTISDKNIELAKVKNIKFVGLAVAYLKTPTMTKAMADAVRKENISQIGIDENTKMPINLDEIAKQIASQFNVNNNLDEALNRTATQFKQEYENKYLGRWPL